MALWSVVAALAALASPGIFLLQSGGADIADEAWLVVAAVSAVGAAGLLRSARG